MPLLASKSQIVRLYLPSFRAEAEDDRGWVDINTGKLTTADLEGVASGSTEVGATVSILANRIVDWNLYDEGGQKHPINQTTIGMLDIEDFEYLANYIKPSNEINDFTDDEKKVSSEQLTPSPVEQISSPEQSTSTS